MWVDCKVIATYGSICIEMCLQHRNSKIPPEFYGKPMKYSSGMFYRKNPRHQSNFKLFKNFLITNNLKYLPQLQDDPFKFI